MATIGGRANINIDPTDRGALSNFISMITRDKTPFMSSLGKTRSRSYQNLAYQAFWQKKVK